MKVFIQLPDCGVPLKVFRKDVVRPRLFKDGLLPPLIKMIECCSDSEDLGGRVKQTNKEMEFEAKEDGEEDEEPSDTPYNEEKEASQHSKDAASSEEETKHNQKKEEVVKSKNLKKRPTQGKKMASKSDQGDKGKKSQRKPAKHVLSEHEIGELARKVEEAGVAELNNAKSACITEVSKLSGLFVPVKTGRDNLISEIAHVVAQGVKLRILYQPSSGLTCVYLKQHQLAIPCNSDGRGVGLGSGFSGIANNRYLFSTVV